jgi:hypothetical protein
MELLQNQHRYLSLYFVSLPVNYYWSQIHFLSTLFSQNCLSTWSLLILLSTSTFISLYCLSAQSLTRSIDFDKYLFWHLLTYCSTYLCQTYLTQYISLYLALSTILLDISCLIIYISLSDITWLTSLFSLLSLSFLFSITPHGSLSISILS